MTATSVGEVWERTFAGWPVRSTQHVDRGKLVERFGTATFVFDVTADGWGMRFRSVSFTWLGIRLPRRLAIEVDAQLTGSDAYWDVQVEIRAPRVGLITAYEGRMTPTLA